MQVRLLALNNGVDLASVIEAGTPTSRHWLAIWNVIWRNQAAPAPAPAPAPAATPPAPAPTNTTSDAQPTTTWVDHKFFQVHEILCDYQHKYKKGNVHAQKTTPRWIIDMDPAFKMLGVREHRWKKLNDLWEAAQPISALFAKFGDVTTRQRRNMPTTWITRVDTKRYHRLFNNEIAFGDIATYRYATRDFQHDMEESDTAENMHIDKMSVHGGIATGTSKNEMFVEVLNRTNMITRRDKASSGERRLDGLSRAIDHITTYGKPVKYVGGTFVGHPNSDLWSTLRYYAQADGFGLLYQIGDGLQNITRESRATSLQHADFAAGEIDMVAAVHQAFLVLL
jgi:hypothetical protein